MSENDLLELPLQQLYENLKEAVRDSISKNGSGWARTRSQTALVLQKSLSQLTHWGTDIRNATHKTLEKLQTEDGAFATTIRNQLEVANQCVLQLRELYENRSNDTSPDPDAEASLAESFQVSIKSLQYQVDPLREFLESIRQPWAQAVVGTDLGSVSFMTDRAQRLLSDPKSDLERLIEACSSNNFERKEFYSAGTLRKIMTAPRITVFLEREYPKLSGSAIHGLVKQIPARFVKVFSILLKINMGGHIAGFIEHNVGDHALPLMPVFQDGVRGLRDQMSAHLLPLTWTSGQLFYFENIQWEFLTPVFDSRHFHHLRLDSRIPLPWRDATESADTAIGRGGFSSVQKFRIEPSSHNLLDITTATIAVKTYENPFGEDESNAFWGGNESNAFWGGNESKALSVIHSLNDPHLIQSYGVVEQGKTMHLIFPYAECNLRQYWRDNSGVLRKPDSSESQSNISSGFFAAWDEMIWLSNQIRGIAQGLATIHDPGNDTFMRHGDIKPENILLMRASKALRGKFVIGDFGLSHVHTTQNPDDEEQKVRYVTWAYMPPEGSIQNGILSRRSDVWSLGCVILEFMCWVLGGNDLNESFALERAAHDPYEGLNSSFFEVAEQHGSNMAKIQPAVVECLQKLRRLPHCTEFVSDILGIVQDHMLVVNSRERISAHGLVRMLNKTHAKVIASKAYAALPIPVQEQVIKVERPPIQGVPWTTLGNEEEDRKAANEVENSSGTHSKLSSDPPMQASKPQSPAKEYGRSSNWFGLTSVDASSRMTAQLIASH